MITEHDITRKFLVRYADLQDVDDLHLATVHSVYLNPSKIEGLNLAALFADAEEDLPVEIQVAEVRIKDKDPVYFAVSSVGGHELVRAKAITEINSSTFEVVRDSLGHKELKKSAFSFSYLRKRFDITVLGGGETIILDAKLSKENELFAVPPFVNIIREVTGESAYYSYNLADDMNGRA